MITDILAGLIGWIVGIFVNYIADVLPLRRKLVTPFCIACDHSYSWFNYAIWPRRCKNCGYRRIWRVLIVEIIYILIAVWLWNQPVEKLGFFGAMLLLAYWGVVVVIDLEYQLIMHPVSIFGAGLGLMLGVYLNGWWNTIFGGIVGFGLMWLLYKFGELIMRLIARKRGQVVGDVALGFGDVNLGGVLGLILGWPAILIGLVLAVILAGFISLLYIIIMLVRGRYQMFHAIPYGPFMIAGAIILVFFRDSLILLLTK